MSGAHDLTRASAALVGSCSGTWKMLTAPDPATAPRTAVEASPGGRACPYPSKAGPPTNRTPTLIPAWAEAVASPPSAVPNPPQTRGGYSRLRCRTRMGGAEPGPGGGLGWEPSLTPPGTTSPACP